MQLGADRARLDVLCVGSGTVVQQALSGDASACVALLCSNSPMLLIGAGPGSLRHTLHHLGQLPPAVFLPAANVGHTAELQAMIQYEASHGRKLTVYGASDVLDQAIASIDEEIVAEVRASVEFLQVELGAPTACHPSFYMLLQRSETRAPRYNLCILDAYQRPLLAYLDGPLSYNAVFQQAPCVIVRQFRGLNADQLYHDLSQTKLLVVGYSAEAAPKISAPAAALRAGDSFVAPTVKGGTAVALPHHPHGAAPSGFDAAHRSVAADHGAYDSGYSGDDAVPQRSFEVRNNGQLRMEVPTRGQPQHSGHAQVAPRTPRQELRPASAQRHAAGERPSAYEQPAQAQQVHYRTTHQPPAPPRKLYVFNNEVKEAEPVIVMVPDHMTLAALKVKIGTLLNVKPFGQLYTVDGGLVRDTRDLQHCQEVVATKHAGAPFDLRRLPHGMQYTRPAVPSSDVMAFP